MYNIASSVYDVIILGTSFAGLCQARHLLLNLPNIRIAMVDCSAPDTPQIEPGIALSTVEIADLFLCKELGLNDYLVEHHLPRAALSFHWPKTPRQTDSLADYYHIWSNRQIPIASFQINPAKFQQDLQQMNQEMGAVFYKGSVVDVELTPGDQLNTIILNQGDETLKIQGQHLIDAADRQFILGRKTNNLKLGAEQHLGLDTGVAWIKVKNVDRSRFDSGYAPHETTASRYYCTNYYFGQGHWVWMLPTDLESGELSIGIVHHNGILPGEGVNTPEKLLAFLQANHNVLFDLIQSGEIQDFGFLNHMIHTSKKMFSEDNWYVIGEAACFYDLFYSIETSLTAFAVESVTEIIRAKQANEVDAEQKRAAYNDFNLGYGYYINCLFRDHDKQLGHASIMSWRIYLDWMWWFGVNVPLYVGKWHLNVEFIPKYLKDGHANVEGLWIHLNQQFNQLVKSGKNLGLMDCYRADQLLGNYTTFKYFDDFLENTKFEPLHCNIFAGLKFNYFYVAIWYILFFRKGFGGLSLLQPKTLYHLLRLLVLSVKASLYEMVYQFKTRNVSDNSTIDEIRQAFKQYKYQPKLQHWMTETTQK